MKVLTQKNIQRIPLTLKTPGNTYVAGTLMAPDTSSNVDKWDVADRTSEYMIMLFSGNLRADAQVTGVVTGIFAENYIVELESGEYEGTIAAGDPITASDETGKEGLVTKADTSTDSVHGLCIHTDATSGTIKCIIWNTQNRTIA